MSHPTVSLGVDPILFLLTVGVLMVLALAGWMFRRRSSRPPKRLVIPAVRVAAFAALVCTAYSADTSWRFADDYLDIAGTAERVAMFAAAELALFATALMARQNMTTRGTPGVPGTLVWVITCVQIIPAYAESGLVGGTVRAFVGPIMAAMLWHLAMGIELRLRTPGAASHGLVSALGREARERVLSRLGIATRNRDAAQITRDRATARAVSLAARLAERSPEQHRSRSSRRLTRRLSKAIGRASVGTDPDQRDALLAQLAAHRHALALATIPLPSPWLPHDDGEATTTFAVSQSGGPAIPIDGPQADAEPQRDRGANEISESGTVGGDRGTGTGGLQGTVVQSAEVPGQLPKGDPGPSGGGPGTGSAGDRGPGGTGMGIDSTGDRGPKVPVRRHTPPKAKGNRSGRSRGPKKQAPQSGPGKTVDQLVEQVRPHVPAALAQGGNKSITRVQLREILRREGLQGVRNDRIGLVLQQLRNEAGNTPTRSTTR